MSLSLYFMHPLHRFSRGGRRRTRAQYRCGPARANLERLLQCEFQAPGTCAFEGIGLQRIALSFSCYSRVRDAPARTCSAVARLRQGTLLVAEDDCRAVDAVSAGLSGGFLGPCSGLERRMRGRPGQLTSIPLRMAVLSGDEREYGLVKVAVLPLLVGSCSPSFSPSGHSLTVLPRTLSVRLVLPLLQQLVKVQHVPTSPLLRRP